MHSSISTFVSVISGILLFLTKSRPIFAAATNRTIDDHYGDSVTGRLPMYESQGWSYGPACSGCLAQPAADKTFAGTWHDTTTNRPNDVAHTVTLLFNGTAIWVYCVVPNRIPHAVTLVNISITLDGQPVGNFTHQPNTSEIYSYNVTVYSNTHLTNTQHLLALTAMQEPQTSLLLFDWAEYTYDDDIENATSSVPLPNPALTKTSPSPASSTKPTKTSPYPSSEHGTTSLLVPLASTSGVLGTITSNSSNSTGSHSRIALILGLVCGGGAIVSLMIILAMRRRRNRNKPSRAACNNRLARQSSTSIINPFVDQLPTDLHTDQYMPSSASVPVMMQERPSESSVGTTMVHSITIDFPETVLSVDAPATLGASESAQPDALEEAREQERFARHVRKFREQVAELRSWAESSRRRPAAFAPSDPEGANSI